MPIKKIITTLFTVLALSTGLRAQAAESPRHLWASLKTVTGITRGQGDRALYIFFDPNCPYCHDLYMTLRPLMTPKHLRVSWIPVGILTLTSYGKAAALLQAKNPTQALDLAERNFRRAGDKLRPQRATVAVKRALLNNVAVLDGAEADGVPFLVYKDRRGLVHTVIGEPPQDALMRIISRLQVTPRASAQKAAPQRQAPL